MISRRGQVLGGILALMMLFGAVAADAKPVAKIDNFIILVDQSGSMYMRHQECGEIVKMALAKQILASMNELICPLGYRGGLYLFAPFQPVLTPAPYNKAQFADAIKKIPDNQPIFDRQTPMGDGIAQIDPVLGQLTGKTAVIIISDGWSNLGSDPVAQARSIYAKYPNVCIHLISLADRKEGKAILGQVNKLNQCSILADGCALCKDGMAQFVRDVFCDEGPEVPVTKEKMILRGIHFDFDKHNIKPEWEPVLNEVADKLRANPNISVVLEGHTDAVGTVEYNEQLGLRRANAVQNYLARKGIAPNRMKVVSYGEMRPIADNNTEEGRAMNRRTEINIVQ
jgi:OOP family OmpA-OmpF porin